MSTAGLFTLIILFLITSSVGVVTGSNSLITVPVMFQFGIDEKVAVATNMFGLTFMAIGATIPFVRSGSVAFRPLAPFVLVTMIGSAIGAALVGFITGQSIKLIVSVAMIIVVAFTFFKSEEEVKTVSPESERLIGSEPFRISFLGLSATFLLAIYGGLYSGGYVTILTAAFVTLLGMTYAGAIAATKYVNVFSSGIATLVFMWQGLVDYKLGAILAVTMFVGAFIGAHFVTKMNEDLLRKIFLGTVVLLAIKLVFDIFNQ